MRRGVFLLPACSTLILAVWLFGGRPMSALRPVVITHLVIGALLAALLPLLFTLRRNFASAGWLAPPSLRSASEVFVALLGRRLADIHPLAAIAGAAVVGLASLAGAWAWRSDPVRIAFIGAVLVLPFALTFAVSHVFQPVFILCVHVWAVLPRSIIAAAGILAAPRLWPRADLASLVGLALSAGVVSYPALWSRPDWRGATRGIAACLAPEDIIVAPRVAGAYGRSRPSGMAGFRPRWWRSGCPPRTAHQRRWRCCGFWCSGGTWPRADTSRPAGVSATRRD